MKKEKLKSSFSTSNLQPLTSNTAITLIALIITIIVLLILATVTLNFILGDNGIIKKASLAKEKTNIAQDKETEELEVLENTINEMSLSRKSSNSSTVLYPGGTKEEPAILNPNQRIEVDNPYPGHRVYCVVEFYVDGYWCNTGFICYTNSSGYGTSAGQLLGENYDKIIIRTGNGAVIINPMQGGGSGNFSKDIASAPYRLIVTCLD